jgi:ferredoxin
VTTYTVRVDKSACISAGKCVGHAPGAFGFDEDDTSTPLPTLGSVPDEVILAAARLCPVSAISVADADGREIFSGD